MYTVTLTIHVDDYHASPTPKHVDTIDEVTSIIEQVQDSWSESGVTVRVTQAGDTFTIRVAN
jgi:flagellin-specific chaperone FliS